MIIIWQQWRGKRPINGTNTGTDPGPAVSGYLTALVRFRGRERNRSPFYTHTPHQRHTEVMQIIHCSYTERRSAVYKPLQSVMLYRPV